MAIDAPVTGAGTSQLMRACAQAPCSSSQVIHSISAWPITRHAFLPHNGRRETSMSVPRCARSFSATMAPRKVIHTKSQRDTSSDTVMPLLSA